MLIKRSGSDLDLVSVPSGSSQMLDRRHSLEYD